MGLSVLACAFSAIQPVHASYDSEETSQSIVSEKAYVYDFETGQVLLDKGSTDRIYPASMTKIMTALVALNSGYDLSTPVTITSAMVEGLAEANASIVGYYIGDTPTMMDLLYGTILPSGADAVNALAYTIAGSIDSYVNMMNQEAQKLGMNDTHFVTPTGLHDDNHYSTCRDIAILLEEALKNDTFRTIFNTREYTDSLGYTMQATINSPLAAYPVDLPGFEGDKTGYTDEAGHCMASYAVLNGMQVITVTAQALTDWYSYDHIWDTSTILTWLSSNYSRKTLYNEGDIIAQYYGKKVIGQESEEVSLAEPISLDVRNDASISLDTDVKEEYTLHNDPSEKTATITIYSDGEQIYSTQQEFTVPKVPDFINKFLTFFRDLF